MASVFTKKQTSPLVTEFIFFTFSERKQLEERQSKDSNEVVLYDEDGNIYEGLQSNFFTIENSQLVTAPDQFVLTGTMQECIFKVCENLNIVVNRKSPNVKQIKNWEGAFVASISPFSLSLSLILI